MHIIYTFTIPTHYFGRSHLTPEPFTDYSKFNKFSATFSWQSLGPMHNKLIINFD